MVLLALLLPAPARALEICDELWFTRNLLFHRADYCFGSVLGTAVFGNEACREGAIDLTPENKALVARVHQREEQFACNVDTSQDFLAVAQLELRKSIADPPMPTDTESACIGWKGGRLPLLAERNDDAVLTGAARDGDMLLFQFEDEGDWSFVEVLQNGIPAGAGWVKTTIYQDMCTSVAG